MPLIGMAGCCCSPPPPCACCETGSQIEIDLSGWSLSGATPSWPIYSAGAAAAAFGRAFFEEFIGSVLIWNETYDELNCQCDSGYKEERYYDSDEKFSISMRANRNMNIGGGVRAIEFGIIVLWVIGLGTPLYINSISRSYRVIDSEQSDCSGSANLPFYTLVGGSVHADMQQFDWYTSGQVAPLNWYPGP